MVRRNDSHGSPGLDVVEACGCFSVVKLVTWLDVV